MITQGLTILIADDNRTTLTLLTHAIRRMGHYVISAKNGYEAIDLYLEHDPDLLLLDVCMPELDGIETTKRLRDINKKYWIPIVLISSLNDTKQLVTGLEAGADDYLFKPINFVILESKIRSMYRIALMQNQLFLKNKELAEYYFLEENEKELVKQLSRYSFLRTEKQDVAQLKPIEYRFLANEHYDRQTLVATRTPTGILHILMLENYSHHGLSGLLNALILTEIFYDFTEKGHTPAYIIEEMNARLHRITSSVYYYTPATFIAVDPVNQLISVWNGANPPVYFFNKNKQVVYQSEPKHLPLGALAPHHFDAKPEILPLDAYLVFLFSNSLLRLDETLHIDLIRLIQGADSQQQVGILENFLLTKQKESSTQESLLFAFVDCELELNEYNQRAELRLRNKTEQDFFVLPYFLQKIIPIQPQFDNENWLFSFVFTESQLRTVDIPPLVLDTMGHIHGIRPHLNQIFLIFSELFSNALDHGILELNSELKRHPTGFEHYIAERNKRLKELKYGRIEVNLKLQRCEYDPRPCLIIRIKDSGKGFDWQNYFLHPDKLKTHRPSIKPYGRGILLVKHICKEIQYSWKGNEVTIHYFLDAQ